MDEKTESMQNFIKYVSLAVVTVFTVLWNIDSPWNIIFLSGLLIASITLRNALILPNEKYSYLAKYTLFIDIILVFIINMFDKNISSYIYYFILVGDASITCSYFFAGGITAAGYLLYTAARYIKSGCPPILGFIPDIAFQSLAFISVFIIMYIVKYEIKQREKLSSIMYELKIKTKQLENTYIKLKETSEDLEEVTILKERNRIAREIHDTVGHTLTTVLLEMEAGERLINQNPDAAMEKIRLAKGQVRKGLSDIRESVNTLKSGNEITDFISSLKLLIDETKKHGGIFIKDEISNLPPLSPSQEKMFYRALQEGLTNGIKHGRSTAFVFKLKQENGYIRFYLHDNGIGSENIIQGFGLTAMEERVKESGGIFSITTKPGEGFCIGISIPVGEDEANGQDQGINCR